MADLIDRQAAIDAVNRALDRETLLNRLVRKVAIDAIRIVPPVQPDTSDLINRIRKEINSKNRNSADYFIVDRIENILDEWENEHGTD